MGCIDHCRFFDGYIKGTRGPRGSAKRCTTCAYRIETGDVKCGCCNQIYRVTRHH